MNSFDTASVTPELQALGWALIHFIWQGAAAAILYAAAKRLMRRRAANVRYAAACGAMAIMLAAFTITLIKIGGSSAAASSPRIGRTVLGLSSGSEPKAMSEAPTVDVAPSPAPIAIAAPVTDRVAALKEWADEWFPSLFPWLVAAWFAGVFLLSIRFIGGLAAARQLRIAASPLLSLWQVRLKALRGKLKVARPVRLCESALVETPTVIGWLRPAILLPASALTGLSPQHLEAILAHELAHIRRHDYLVNLLQSAVETLLFYHPAVWWISKQIRQEREHCCDDLAVASCGDVLVYARALAELEGLRSLAPQFAVAASGGSLLHRIQRLLSRPAAASRPGDTWLAGVVALAAVFTLLAATQTTLVARSLGARIESNVEEAPPSAKNQANTGAGQNRNAAAERAVDPAKRPDALAEGDADQDKATLAVKADPGPTDQAQEIQAADQIEQPSKSGDFIAEMSAQGYDHLTVDQLIELKTHNITAEFIREMKALVQQKLSVDDLVAMRIHGVTSQAAAGFKQMGYSNLSAEELVAFRIHGVSPQFVDELKAAGYDHVSADSLIAFRIHGVTPEFIREMKSAGLAKLSADELVEMKIHNVSPALIQTMRGYVHGELSADRLTAMQIHGVTPEFIKELEALGYANLSADQLTELRIHGVTPAFIKAVEGYGFKKPTVDQLTALRIFNVTPEFIATVKSRGFNDVTLNQLIELRRLNIVPSARNK